MREDEREDSLAGCYAKVLVDKICNSFLYFRLGHVHSPTQKHCGRCIAVHVYMVQR